MKNKILLPFLVLFLTNTINLFAAGSVPYLFNLPTFQTNGSRIFMLDVGHRYFDVNRHTTNINISLSYGIIDSLDVLLGFSFKNKDIVLNTKYNLLNDFDSKDLLSLSFVAGGGFKDTNAINNSLSLSFADTEKIEAQSTLPMKDRPSFFTQVVIQKHFFSNRLFIGLVPSFAYNTNFFGVHSTYDFTFGTGFLAGFYIFDSVSICSEVTMNIFGFAFKYVNYNAGVKYAGYRHTFTLYIGNSAGYSPVEYLTGNNTWSPKVSFAFTREFDI